MSTLSAALRTAEPASGSLVQPSNTPSLAIGFRIPCLALAIALGSFLFFFYCLHQRDLWSSHEARAAQNAISVLSGQWLVPELFDGRLELQKPPLYYWLIAAWCWLTDRPVDALAVRLPAALAASCVVITILALGYRLGRLGAAIFAVGALLLMPRFVWLARVGRIDMPLTACLTVAFTATLMLRQLASPLMRYLCFLSMLFALAAGVLFKGPITLVLFAVVTMCNWCCERWGFQPGWSIRDLAARFHPAPLTVLSAVMVSAAVLLWYIAANAVTEGGWVREFLYRHNLARGLGGDPQLDRHGHWLGPAFYLVRLLFDAGPVTLLAIWLACKSYTRIRDDSTLRFFAIWFIVLLIFFSCMRYKRADYLLPAYPALALFVGFRLDEYINTLTCSWRRRWYFGYSAAVAFSGLGWGMYIIWVLPIVNEARQEREFAIVVRNYCGPGQTIYMFGTEAHLLSYHLGPPIHRTYDTKQVITWLAAETEPLYIVVSRKAFAQIRELSELKLSWEIITSNERRPLPGWWRWWSDGTEERLLLVRAYRPPG